MSDRRSIRECRSVGERLAVYALRHSVDLGWRCESLKNLPGPFSRSLCQLAAELHDFHEMMLASTGRRLDLGVRNARLVTRHEHRLLRSMAAAQNDENAVVDNYLFKLAPERRVRGCLAGLVEKLAAALGVEGYWLSDPSIPSLPGPAFPVARLHSIDLATLRAAWPRNGVAISGEAGRHPGRASGAEGGVET